MIQKLKLVAVLLLGIAIQCISSSIVAQTKTNAAIKVAINGTQLQLEFYTPKIVRVIKSKETLTALPAHLYIQALPKSVTVISSAKGNLLTYKTGEIQVNIDKTTGAVSFIQNNKTLLREDANSFVSLNNKPGFYRIKQAFLLDKDEPVYGLGQHQKGMMSQRNQQLLLRQNNKEICIPILQSVKGYGIIWNNETPTLFSDDLKNTYFLSDEGRAIDYFFIAGGSTNKVVAGIHYLTGNAPMPPRWAFGYFQSKERYQSQREVLDVIERYRKLRVPLDCIVQDWQYWGTDFKVWNAVNFGNPAFPRPKDMIDSIHQMNAHIIISVWPSFGPKTAIFKTLEQKGLLYPASLTFWLGGDGVSIYKPFSKMARDIYWGIFEQKHFLPGYGWLVDGCHRTC